MCLQEAKHRRSSFDHKNYQGLGLCRLFYPLRWIAPSHHGCKLMGNLIQHYFEIGIFFISWLLFWEFLISMSVVLIFIIVYRNIVWQMFQILYQFWCIAPLSFYFFRVRTVYVWDSNLIMFPHPFTPFKPSPILSCLLPLPLLSWPCSVWTLAHASACTLLVSTVKPFASATSRSNHVRVLISIHSDHPSMSQTYLWSLDSVVTCCPLWIL